MATAGSAPPAPISDGPAAPSQTAGPNGAMSTPPDVKRDGSVPRNSPDTVAPNAEAEASPSLTKPEVEKEPSTADSLILDNLKKLISTGPLNRMNAGVKAGLQILEDLKAPLRDMKDDKESREWLDAISKLEAQTQPAGTVVSVVGGTGVGKSSAINAVLDMERVLPTNGVRACTAVVTEISWNDSDEPNQRYRAEVEFVSRESWREEVARLYHDMLDSNRQLSRDHLNGETVAGVAYAKIKAVYPTRTQTKEMTASCNPEELANDPEVCAVLGTVKHITSAAPKAFYSELQKYLDSKEKVSMTKKDKNGAAFWPLIKVVRVYVKAEALSTGIVLADLPGVQDANAARSAVADRYMAQCTAIWVVSPIARAVDDKVAKDLLGKSFRQQLRMDGTYSNVTFICSKTDDISILEAAETLDERGQLQELNDREVAISQELDLKVQPLWELTGKKEQLALQLTDVEKEAKEWEKIRKRLAKGKKPRLPVELVRRRKLRAGPKVLRQVKEERNVAEEGENADSSSSDDEEEEASNEMVEEEMSRLEQERSGLLANMAQLGKEISALEQVTTSLREEKDSLSNERAALCVQMRNNYAKSAIRLDFAAGIKEMDEEHAAHENADGFDPEQEIRDYDKVAQSLPVFCISSRAYQQHRGRCTVDNPVKGFRDVSETEIPQLQQHAKSLTEAGQISASKRFLNSLQHFLVTLMIGVTGNRADVKPALLNEEDRAYEITHLDYALTTLAKNLDETAAQAAEGIALVLKAHIYDKHDRAVKFANTRAEGIVRGWSAPKTAGGLAYNTYKAICRRGGSWGADKKMNFNEDLTGPLRERLAVGWDHAFSQGVPEIFDKFADTAGKHLVNFHEGMKGRPSLRKAKEMGLELLSQQIQACVHSVRDMTATWLVSVRTHQRETNRMFTPEIQAAMQPAYRACTTESGPGSYSRVKATMLERVHDLGDTMYQTAVTKARGNLDELCGMLDKEMDRMNKDLVDHLRNDYRSVILRSEAVDASESARRYIGDLVKAADTVFADANLADHDAGGDGSGSGSADLAMDIDVPESAATQRD